MPPIKKWGNKLIDIDYYSKKFGWVEMDVTIVETPPTRETYEYILKSKERRATKNKEKIVKDGNDREESI